MWIVVNQKSVQLRYNESFPIGLWAVVFGDKDPLKGIHLQDQYHIFEKSIFKTRSKLVDKLNKKTHTLPNSLLTRKLFFPPSHCQLLPSQSRPLLPSTCGLPFLFHLLYVISKAIIMERQFQNIALFLRIAVIPALL